jgi:hypothetical protein
MGLFLDQAIARLPFLKDAQDIKVTQLTGGITNTNYHINANSKSYALRINGEDTDLLGIHRGTEYKANLLDLANFSHHHLLNNDRIRILLQEYFNEVIFKNLARLKLM